MQGGAEDSKLGLVFVMTGLHSEAVQELTKGCLIRTKDIPITQEIPRDLVAVYQ